MDQILLLRYTYTAFQKQGILIVKAAQKVISIHEFFLERLFTFAKILQQFAEVLIPIIEFFSHLFSISLVLLLELLLHSRRLYNLLKTVFVGCGNESCSTSA